MRSLSGIFLAQLVLCVGIITGEDDSSWRCPQGLPDTTAVYTYNDQCFQFVDNEVYWTGARAYCMRHGGALIKIDDPGTNRFIVRTLNALPWNNRGVWIGLHDRNGELDWEWVTKSPLVEASVHWTNWGRGHPKGLFHGLRDCVRMVRGRRHDWLWHETFCSMLNWKYRFICQYDAEPLTTPRPRVVAAPRRHLRRGGISHLQDDEWQQAGALANGDTASDLRAEDSQLGMPVSGREMAVKEERGGEGKHSGLGLITTITISCMVGSLVGIVLLVLLLARRRRRQQAAEDPTLHIDNPIYGPQEKSREKMMNDYTVNVYSNPLDLHKQLSNDRPPAQIDFDQLRTTSPAENKWDYINTVNNLTTGYLPMDGGKATKGPDTEGHIYEDIPGDSLEDLLKDAEVLDEYPEDSQIYEVLQDPKDNASP